MNGLEIGMVVLVVVVVCLIAIILFIYFRGRKSQPAKPDNDVIMLMEPDTGSLQRNSGRESPYTGQPLTPKRLRQKGQASALSSFKMELSDKEKLDALLKMREVCDNVNEIQEVESDSDNEKFIRAVNEQRPSSPPPQPTRRMRGMQMFGGLDNDEEDELLLELDNTVPQESTEFKPQPLIGVDRDAQHASEKMFDTYTSQPLVMSTNANNSAWSVTSPATSSMKNAVHHTTNGDGADNDEDDTPWDNNTGFDDSDLSRTPTPTTIL
eukprot:m.41259 g.41259  ORF g.41259 m.41259 type:complete len:267 (+) comp18741_c0_seq1:523-1323(+)